MNYNQRLENNIKLSVAEGMEKRYCRIYQRHKKKAMPELTLEQFAEKVRKEENSLVVIEVIMAFLYILIFLYCIFREICASVPKERSAIPLKTEHNSAG